MITAQELDQDFSQHTGAREMRLTSKAAEKPRTTTDTDLSHSRGAYLGTWRQAYRQVKDVIANPDNGKAVMKLKQEIERKWTLYARAHHLYSERARLSDQKKEKLDKEFSDHYQQRPSTAPGLWSTNLLIAPRTSDVNTRWLDKHKHSPGR